MATFDDFNFGDDSGAVDTDPVPDNDNLDANQSTPTDNKQDDTLNFPEPGQSDVFEGGQPTEFDVQGNANESTAQSDHIPPISSVRQMFDAHNTRARHWEQDVQFAQFEEDNKPPNPITVRQMLDERTVRLRHEEQDREFDRFKEENKPREPFSMRQLMADRAEKIRHDEQDAEFEKLNPTAPELSIRQMFALYKGLPSSYISPDELNAMWQDFLTTGKWYPPQRLSRSQARRETSRLWGIGEKSIIGGTFDFTQDSTAEADADGPLVDQYGALLDATAALILIPDSVINDIFDDASMISLLDEYNKGEASWGRIDGQDDFANTIDNPSGIGELFDQLLVSGNDAFMAIDSAQDVDGLVSSDFLSMDAYVEEMDIRDYVGDLTLNSDIIEFQNMGTNVLEDFDGVL